MGEHAGQQVTYTYGTGEHNVGSITKSTQDVDSAGSTPARDVDYTYESFTVDSTATGLPRLKKVEDPSGYYREYKYDSGESPDNLGLVHAVWVQNSAEVQHTQNSRLTCGQIRPSGTTLSGKGEVGSCE